LAKYHTVKERTGETDAATLQLWREDAERAYWEANDPQYLSNVPPQVIRSYEPGTAHAFPALPELAKEQSDVIQVEDLYDARDEVKAAVLKTLPHTDMGKNGPRKGQRWIKRSENMVENALRRDGTVLKHLVRPFNELACIAVTSTPLAVEFVSARGRGKVLADNGESITAMHVSVQRAAFAAHPISLMLFPDKFDEQLTRQVYEPRVFKFAAELTELYGRWVQLGKSFDVSHHKAINTALLEYATGSKVIKDVPLLHLMEKDAQAGAFVALAKSFHNDEMVDAARQVLDQMAAPAIETIPMPEGVDGPDVTGESTRF
jgi:hypothetical protein